MLEKTFESPLDCKAIQPVNPKGSQSWIFIGGTDAEAETPILWPPDAKNWLIGKDPDTGKDWRWEEKGTTGWDVWMTSPSQWTWVWVSSRSWWWTGRPGVLQSMGSQSRTWLSDWTELTDAREEFGGVEWASFLTWYVWIDPMEYIYLGDLCCRSQRVHGGGVSLAFGAGVGSTVWHPCRLFPASRGQACSWVLPGRSTERSSSSLKWQFFYSSNLHFKGEFFFFFIFEHVAFKKKVTVKWHTT